MTVAFVLANSAHGPMIVNRFDYNTSFDDKWYGVGAQILENGAYEPKELEIIAALLTERRTHFGDGVIFVDCGANIGTHSLAMARHMQGWGSVIAIEAQERLFYALAGNLALNNCSNARAIWGAVDREDGYIDIPEPKYDQQSSFGSFELRERFGTENIGQGINYERPNKRIQAFKIDSAECKRIDFIKLDIGGMEMEALAGAEHVIERFKPMLWVECIKIDDELLQIFLSERHYRFFRHGLNALGIHEDDPGIKSIVTHTETI